MSLFTPPSTTSSDLPPHARLAVMLVSVWFAGLGWLLLFLTEQGSVRWWGGMVTAPLALVTLLLAWRGFVRPAASWLVCSGALLIMYLAWNSALHQTTTVLVLTVLVVFSCWVQGWLVAGAMTGVWLLFGVAQVYRGLAHPDQVLAVGYVMLFLLGMTWLMLRGYTLQVHGLRVSMRRLAKRKQRMRVLSQAVEQNPDSVLIVDLDGRLVYANRAYELRSGYQRHEVMGHLSREVSLTGLTPEQHTQMWEAIEAGKLWEGVVHNTLKDGRAVVDEVRISPVLGDDQTLSYLVETRHDITEKLEAEQRIRHLQEFDTLTQLPNRQSLMQSLSDMIEGERAPWGTQPYAFDQDWHLLLLVDVDRFTTMQAGHGREWLDSLLQAFATKLETLVPEHALLARVQDSQFAVVLTGVGASRQDARLRSFELAQELQSGLRHVQLPAEHGLQGKLNLSCSVGFTVFPFVEPGLQLDDGDRVLRRASIALSQARHQGGNQVHAYSEVLDEAVQRRVQVEKDLAVALQAGQLRVFLQPQVDMGLRVVGAEALVRWIHPEQGMVSPGEFIPVAEDCGLIIPLGEWMMEQVCLLLNDSRVQDAGYGISVNVSALQFEQPEFVNKVRDVLQRTGAPADRLTLEVTESLLLSDVEVAIQKMLTLHALGVQFALDDFGTAYSSLAYLMRLPIQEIKLDQAFIRDLTPASDNSVLVEALLMVAKAKGLRVVAEGVEHAEQAQLLQAWEPSILCQGYLFSRPVLAQRWLENPQLNTTSLT